jgi:hypothetical protein
MDSLSEAYNNPEAARKRKEELNRFIHSDEHKNMWIERGFAKDVVDKYPEEFFYIDWLYTHVNFQEGFVNFHEDTIRYFLDDDYPEEFLAEYFNHEWQMDKSEIDAIINRVKSEHA